MIFEIEKLAEKFSGRTAYVYGEEQTSYEQLFDRAQKIAEKIKNGDYSPAVVFGGKNSETMAAILACIIAKRAYVPIDPAMPKERKNKIIAASGAGIILDCTGKGVKITEASNDAQTAKENDTAYIIFTSGSTGEPKGVPISYDNLDNFIGWISSLEPLCEFEHTCVLNHAAFSFDLSTAAVFYALFGGHTLVQFGGGDEFDGIFDAMQKNRTDVIVATPTFLRLCMLNKEFCEAKFPFVKCIYFCGETLQKSLCKAVFERFPHMGIINAYGPTEATSAVCAAEITRESLEHEEILPCGKISSAAAEIVIEDDEIVLKGKSVFGGYLDGAEGGHYKAGEKDCYRTGDLGFIKDGKLYCKGRKDGQIKYKGYRIELSDIEANIAAMEGVESCAVIAKKNAEGEVRLIKAFVSGGISEMSIRENLLRKLPGYMIPKSIKVLEKLPVNRNGKIDRKKLETL